MVKTIKKHKEEVTKDYIISEAYLKKKLGLSGNIESIELWQELSSNDEEKGVSKYKTEWIISTKEHLR